MLLLALPVLGFAVLVLALLLASSWGVQACGYRRRDAATFVGAANLGKELLGVVFNEGKR